MLLILHCLVVTNSNMASFPHLDSDVPDEFLPGELPNQQKAKVRLSEHVGLIVSEYPAEGSSESFADKVPGATAKEEFTNPNPSALITEETVQESTGEYVPGTKTPSFQA